MIFGVAAKVMNAVVPLIARFMGPTGGPPGADRTQVGPMLAPWTLLSAWSTKHGYFTTAEIPDKNYAIPCIWVCLLFGCSWHVQPRIQAHNTYWQMQLPDLNTVWFCAPQEMAIYCVPACVLDKPRHLLYSTIMFFLRKSTHHPKQRRVDGDRLSR